MWISNEICLDYLYCYVFIIAITSGCKKDQFVNGSNFVFRYCSIMLWHIPSFESKHVGFFYYCMAQNTQNYKTVVF